MTESYESHKPLKARKKPRREPSPKPVNGGELLAAAERALADDSKIFRARPDQHLARARLWLEARDNPQLAVASLSASQLAQICRDRRVLTWCRSPEFREWLTAPRDTEERIESAYSQFVEGLEFRRAGMSDKDYINCLKLLAEIASKMPKKWENVKVLDADVGRMTEEQQIQTMVDALRRLGFSISRGDGRIDIPAPTGYSLPTGAESGAGARDDGPGPTTPPTPSDPLGLLEPEL